MAIKQWLRKIIKPQKITDPQKAYDAWAAAYDDQPGNLMLELDTQLLDAFLREYAFAGKVIADIGCGTGRHWPKLLALKPARLVGYDVSKGMLEKLEEKVPGAELVLLKDNHLDKLTDKSCDLVMSTLAVAHIPDLEDALREWNRVLKPGGTVYVTDYHPEALARGGERTFKLAGKTISVRNHVHAVDRVRELAGQLGWKESRFTERYIDDEVKDFYIRQRALPIFEKFRGTRIIYAIQFKKKQ